MKRIRLLILLALITPVHAADTLATLESEARSLLTQGRAMNRNDPGSCGSKMRELQPQAKKLQAKADSLPESPEKFWLSVAASQLKLCVSCHRQLGPENCRYVAESLREMSNRR